MNKKDKDIVEFNKKHIDNVTHIFHAIMGEHFHWGYFDLGINDLHVAQNRLVDELAKLGEVTSDKKVLDVGCGVGGTAMYMAEKYCCSAVGFTNSEIGIQMANEKLKSKPNIKNVKFIVTDALDNKLPDNTYDLVIMIEAAYMIPDKKRLFQENFRVLKDGGIMLICDNMTLRNMTLAEMFKHNSGIVALKSIFGEGRYGTLEQYMDIARQANFSQVEVFNLGENVYQTINYVLNNIDNNINELKEEFEDKLVDNFRMSWEETRMLCDEGISSYGVLKAVKRC